MEEHEVIVQLVLMHAALQGSVAAGTTGDAELIAERAWQIVEATMRLMPPEFRQELVKLGEK